MQKKNLTNIEYLQFLQDIKLKVSQARLKASRAVNKELIKLYLSIGEEIVKRQKIYRWGDNIVELLAKDLTESFPGVQGFSLRNVWNMRRFYETYKGDVILQQLVAEIPWGHNVLIMEKVSDTKAREYYIRATKTLGWSRNVLLNQILADAYSLQKDQSKKHNFSLALPDHLAEQVQESLKSVYNLDFLGITKPFYERELEKRLVEKMKTFLLELGLGFSFIGNQYRLELDGDEYFVDLLFFNRNLRCLVAVELKTGKFKPEYAGKMDFYLHLLNDQVKLKCENPSIGIILCADKSNITVEYALRSAKNPMGVAKYHLTSKPSSELKKVLPSDEELKSRMLAEIK
jgi:predicted nuclease of restriction endonuclease-like (RecB) superfamily